MSKSLMQAFSEVSAKGFVDGLTKRQLKKMCELPQEKLEELVSQVYDLIKEEVKRQFIKAAVLELKARAVKSHKNST